MKYIRLFIALLLLPLVFNLALGLFDMALSLGQNVSTSSLPFWLGLASYFVFQVIFFQPIRTYVFGHELTHAIVGLLSGAKLKGFKVSASGGSVKLSKTNIIITLSPYFIPIYTGIIILAYWIAGRFADMGPYHAYFLFAVGFSLAFHFALTRFALAQGQSDLKHFGVFFSGIFVLLINCIILACLLKLLFPGQIALKDYFLGSAKQAVSLFQLVYSKVKDMIMSTRF